MFHDDDLLTEAEMEWSMSAETSGATDASIEESVESCIANLVLAADACVILSCMYPSELAIAAPIVHKAYALCVPLIHEELAKGEPLDASSFTMQSLLADHSDAEEMLSTAKKFWKAFNRPEHDGKNCAWRSGVAPILAEMILRDGRHPETGSDCARMRELFENLTRNVYRVYSPDGVAPPLAPHPCSLATSIDCVNSNHIDPVFTRMTVVGDPESARGAAIGVLQFQARQCCTLLAACSSRFVKAFGTPKNAKGKPIRIEQTQIYQNNGPLCARPSSDANVKQCDGRDRSLKSSSSVNLDRDKLAFGDLDARREVCAAQTRAFDLQAEVMSPMFLAICPPASSEIRNRGEYDAARRERQLKNRDQARLNGIATGHQNNVAHNARVVFNRGLSSPHASRSMQAVLQNAQQHP